MTDAESSPPPELIRATLERRIDSLRGYLTVVASRRGFGRPEEAWDVSDYVQETMLAAVRNLNQGFGPRGDESVEHWLRRRLFDLVKQRRRVVRRNRVALDFDPADSTTSVGGKAMSNERAALLRNAVDALADEDRIIVKLWIEDGRKLVEIAREVGRSVPFVRKRLRLALDELRLNLREASL